MRTTPFDPLHYCKRGDAPFFFGSGLLAICKLQFRHGVRLLKLALACLALSACAPHPVATVYCLTPPQLQKLKDAEPPLIGDKLTGDAQDDFKLVAGSDVMLRQYGHDLIHVLENCTGTDAK